MEWRVFEDEACLTLTPQAESLESIATTEALYESIGRALGRGVRAPLSLDLSPLRFIRIDALLGIITAARYWWRKTGYTITLTAMQPQVYGYLDRMNIFSVCSPWLRSDRMIDGDERFYRATSSARLLELSPISGNESENADNVDEAMRRARAILQNLPRSDRSTVGRICSLLSEITTNVVHSHDSGFAIIQRYDPGGGGAWPYGTVVIGVADLGIGIEESLRQNRERIEPDRLSSLNMGSEYLLQSLEIGVTARPGAGGQGLHLVRKTVEEWRGNLTIRSRSSLLDITARGVEQRDNLPDIPGTQVFIVVQG